MREARRGGFQKGILLLFLLSLLAGGCVARKPKVFRLAIVQRVVQRHGGRPGDQALQVTSGSRG